MKKIILILVAIFMVFSVYAGSNSFTFKAGYYFPAEFESGIIWGADYGYVIDENVSLLLGGDLYYKSIRDIKKPDEIEQVGVKQEEITEVSEWTGLHIPLTGKVKIKIPANSNKFKPYGIAGLGVGFTHVSFKGTHQDDGEKDESLTYSGFVWQLGGGAMYRIGSRSNLLVEMIYNGAKFEKEHEDYFTTLNSGGLMFRVGINVLMF